MREKKATLVIVVVAAVIVTALLVFSIARYWGHYEHPAAHEDKGKHPHVYPEKLELSGEIARGVRVVKMAARQHEFDPNIVAVKHGEKVRLEVTSEDVTHGIAIENYDIDRRLEPKKTEVITFTADKPGRHHFHCSVYCGVGHADMRGELVVLEDTE